MTVPYEYKTERAHRQSDPYLSLAAGVVLSACQDVKRKNGRAAGAAKWLRGEECLSYCDATGLDFESIQRWLNQRQTQPAKSGTTNPPLGTNGEEKETMTTQPPEPTTPKPVDDFSRRMAQLDAEGQSMMDAIIEQALQRAESAQQKRRPTGEFQDRLRAEYEHALANLPHGGHMQRIELRAKFRARGLAI